MDECHRHERLLDRCFDDRPFTLLCPYDDTLDDEVQDDARVSRRGIHEAGHSGPSVAYRPEELLDRFFQGELSPPPVPTTDLAFGPDNLGTVRRFVEAEGRRGGLAPDRASDLVLAADEIAVNSLIHGGAGGVVRCWIDGGNFVYELTGSGTITDPVFGRVCLVPEWPGGRGACGWSISYATSSRSAILGADWSGGSACTYPVHHRRPPAGTTGSRLQVCTTAHRAGLPRGASMETS